jgi:hypothetical protein
MGLSLCKYFTVYQERHECPVVHQVPCTEEHRMSVLTVLKETHRIHLDIIKLLMIRSILLTNRVP